MPPSPQSDKHRQTGSNTIGTESAGNGKGLLSLDRQPGDPALCLYFLACFFFLTFFFSFLLLFSSLLR